MRAALAPIVAASLLGACGGSAPAARVLRLGVPYELASLDPHAENTLSSYAILSNVYEPLAGQDPSLRLVPALAESWESPDALTWVFHLRPGVMFHGGRPLRAQDVVFSVERLLRDPALDIRSYVRDVEAVRALDPATVEIRTGRPSRILLSKLRFVLIVPEGSLSERLASGADGTGPYVLEAWTPGREVRLRGNPRYWGKPPAFAEARYALARPPGEAVVGLLAGEYDFVEAEASRSEEALRSSPRHAIVRHENIYLKLLGYDLSREVTPFCRAIPNPFRNPKVRRALHLALDRRRLVNGLSRRGIPAVQAVPRVVFGFDPGLLEPQPDLDQARALLREAGLPGGFDVTLHARRIFSEPAALVRDQLAAVGVRVEVRPLSDPEYFAALGRREASFWLTRWGCATGDASDLLELYVHSTDAQRRLGQTNYSGYSNPELDRVIESSAGIEDPGARSVAVQRILRTLMEELVLLPLYYDEDVYALDRGLLWRPRYDSYVRAAEFGRGADAGARRKAP